MYCVPRAEARALGAREVVVARPSAAASTVSAAAFRANWPRRAAAAKAVAGGAGRRILLADTRRSVRTVRECKWIRIAADVRGFARMFRRGDGQLGR